MAEMGFYWGDIYIYIFHLPKQEPSLTCNWVVGGPLFNPRKTPWKDERLVHLQPSPMKRRENDPSQTSMILFRPLIFTGVGSTLLRCKSHGPGQRCFSKHNLKSRFLFAMDGLSESLLERAIGRGEDKSWRHGPFL